MNQLDAESIAQALGGAKKQGRYWRCLCPSHDDTNPSLDVTDDPEKGVLVICRSGCPQDAVVSALKGRGLWPSGNGTGGHYRASEAVRAPETAWTITASSEKEAARIFSKKHVDAGFAPIALHPWRNREGEPLFWRARLKHSITGEKRIFPFHRDAASKYAKKEPEFSGPKSIYGLEQFAEPGHSEVWIVEGEQKVDALRKLGLVAVTSGSSSSARGADWQPLRERRAVIWRDNDPAGERYAVDVTRELEKLRCSIEWIDVEQLGLPQKGDCVDWLHEHGTADGETISKLPRIKPTLPGEPKATESMVSTGKAERPTAQDEAPIPLDETKRPAIPALLLPDVFADFAAAVSSATETPESLSTILALSILSACFSRCAVVSPWEGWCEPVNIYTLTALPPGSGKSPVFRKFLEPVELWERNQYETLRDQIKRERAERKNQEKRIEHLRAKAAKVDDPLERRFAYEEINTLESELIEPTIAPRMFISDCTPEALAACAAEQKGRFAIFSDEGGIFEVLAGLYSKDRANVDIVLKGIDGGAVRIQRRDREINVTPFLTLALCVQPVVISRMGARQAFQGNGLHERFLYCLPDCSVGYRQLAGVTVPDSVRSRYVAKVQEYLLAAHEHHNANRPPVVLTLDADALREWSAFRAEVERQQRPGGKYEHFAAYASKVAGYALRIAGLLCLGEHGLQPRAIDVPLMNKALEFMSLLLQHAQAAFQLMRQDEQLADAKILLRHLERLNKPEVTLKELRHSMRGDQAGRGDRLAKAIDLLIERRWILKAETVKGTTKPTTIYFTNPTLLNNLNNLNYLAC